ncbi:MAG: hypothetical protein WAZ94_04565 [Phycisphaerales bacterium]
MRISGSGMCGAVLALGAASAALAANTQNILITGYWPPTNEMLRQWSQNPAQNPGGWQGLNWEGRGYNIYSYFPEFPGGTGVNPRGTGDFQVDYQAASADFWRVTSELHPVAIITFSRGSSGSNWELESRARKLPLNSWTPDYLAPTRPTPDLPIALEPDNNIRFSSLPMTQIRSAVAAANLPLTAFIDTSNDFGGTFVSEFTSYHSAWYANLHSAPEDPFRTFAGGHIHVGISTPTATAVTATEITLRTLTDYLDQVIPAPSSVAVMAAGLLGPGRRRR